MIGVDYVILGVLLISSFISLIRGFVKEALSLVGWVLSFWVSLTFSGGLSELLGSSIENSSFRLIIAFVALFVISLIISTAINFFAVRLVQRTGLSGTDRFLGVVFGFLRGVLLVSVLVLLSGLTALPKEPMWQESALLFRFQAVAVLMQDFLPDSVAGNFHF
ncbi:Colicin V production protein [hydrothermal vent metagenome]|uniref:Colicin V production protein n=1 Tax=hydrothermal vent metagenome TaxID=652676 RepID=A0A3B1BKL6_9ZZZZ